MCSMEKCSQKSVNGTMQTALDNTHGKQIGYGVLINNAHGISDMEILNGLKESYGNESFLMQNLLLKRYASDNYVIFYRESCTAVQIDRIRFKNLSKRLKLNRNLKLKFAKARNITFMRVSNNVNWRPEFTFAPSRSTFLGSLFAPVMSAFDAMTNAMSVVNKMKTKDFRLFMIDIMAIIVEVREGFLTFGKIFSVLMSLYTSYHRFNDIFQPQTATISDLAIGFAMIGLPSKYVELIKSFAVLTGKRLFDNNVIYTCISTLSEILNGIVDFFHSPREGLIILPSGIYKLIKHFLHVIFGSFDNYKKMQIVVDLYTQFVRNPQITFDPLYRAKVEETYKSCINADGFLEYVINVNNKYINTTWIQFRDTVLKSIQAFGASRREEPICFVFEGEAGSGKSTIMNAFVDLFRAAQRTVYCHSVPSTEDAKDFYDDYSNQEVFVTDDCGQQGKSQWRMVINFVSPVVYPLPCATASLKNTKSFNSKVILITTNKLSTLGGFTSSDCISTPEALFRRIHLIKVNKNMDDAKFSQTLSYHKYDHLGDNTWKNEFLYHNACDIPTQFDNRTSAQPLQDSLKWIWKIFKHVESREAANRTITELPASFFKAILNEDIYVDAREDDQYEHQSLLTDLVNTLNDGGLLLKEWAKSVVDEAWKYLTWITSILTGAMASLLSGQMAIMVKLPSWISQDEEEIEVPFFAILICITIITAVVTYCLTRKGTWKDMSLRDNFNRGKERARLALYQSESGFVSQMDKDLECIPNERIRNVGKACRMIVIKHSNEGDNADELCQTIVSGRYMLLPAHMCVHKRFVDVYMTLDHYENRHKELENVELEIVKLYTSCDLALYKIKGTIPLYKKCWNIFPDATETNPEFYLLNSIGAIKIIYGASLHSNDHTVSYSRYVHGKEMEFKHLKGTGAVTPLSGPGLCGTVLVSNSGGVVGLHVAGNGNSGFCVIPPKVIAQEIRNIITADRDVDFDLDRSINEGVSGVRIRYPANSVKVTRTLGESAFEKTVFHKDHNMYMAKLCAATGVVGLSSVEVAQVATKAPPIFKASGTPAKLLKEISMKTFKHQGVISHDEIEFLATVIDSMLIPFDDITDEECAFGGENCSKLNKDSSNGYGLPTGKDVFIDYENRKITELGKKLFSEFEKRAIEKDYDFRHFLSRESFKDELREESKRATPRTFRVMPLPHIWWMKKTCAKLIPHFKRNMHKFGCGVGLNPYKDFDVIARKLSSCHIVGDIDFKQWDGSIMAPLMRMIAERLLEHYQGLHREVLEYVLETIITSTVLINDEVWLTTHGLPSGTWLTLLMNCLLNKCITALTLYRNKPKCTLEDVFRIVDYVVGDDKIFGVPKDLSEYFNLLTVKAVAESLGMTCTNGDKTMITKPTQDFEKMSFVKRHFRKHFVLQGYVGVLSIDTILNTLQWFDSTKDQEETIVGKMRSVQVEAYLHGTGLFNQLTDIMKESYPFAPLFDEQKVIEILQSEDGYTDTMLGLGKDLSFLDI